MTAPDTAIQALDAQIRRVADLSMQTAATALRTARDALVATGELPENATLRDVAEKITEGERQ